MPQKDKKTPKRNIKKKKTETFRDIIEKRVEKISDWGLFLAKYVPLIFGILWLIVGILQEIKTELTLQGLFLGSIVGMAIIIASLAAIKNHVFGGFLLLAEGFFGIYLILIARFAFLSKLIMVITLCLPLVIPGIFLIIRHQQRA